LKPTAEEWIPKPEIQWLWVERNKVWRGKSNAQIHDLICRFIFALALLPAPAPGATESDHHEKHAYHYSRSPPSGDL